MTPRPLCLAFAVSVAVGLSGCGKPDPVVEMEKAAATMEKTPPAAPAPSASAEPAPVPAREVKQAITDFKAGKLEDAVTRMQLLRAQPTMSPDQRMALQDSLGAMMTEIYSLAEKGDPRAVAAVAQYEKMQTSH